MAYKLWTPEEETLLKDLVASGLYSFRDMEKFFEGRSLSSLTKHARHYLDINNNIYKQHKYTYDKAFFNAPNELNSYVAGFLAADGCVQYHEPASPTIMSEVIKTDWDHLDGIKKALGYTGVMREDRRGVNTVQFKMTCSHEYCDNLKRHFGVTAKKTLHLTPPSSLSPDQTLAFVIGIIDGDGCVHMNVRGGITLSFASASENMTKWLLEKLNGLKLPVLKDKGNPQYRALTNCKAYTFSVGGAKVVAFIKLVQAFAAHYNLPILRRKWDTPRLNEYIRDFEIRYPQFSYTPPAFPLEAPVTAPLVALPPVDSPVEIVA